MVAAVATNDPQIAAGADTCRFGNESDCCHGLRMGMIHLGLLRAWMGLPGGPGRGRGRSRGRLRRLSYQSADRIRKNVAASVGQAAQRPFAAHTLPFTS